MQPSVTSLFMAQLCHVDLLEHSKVLPSFACTPNIHGAFINALSTLYLGAFNGFTKP